MLSVFDKRPLKRSIFVDFAYMDERETEYIRKMYEMASYYGYQMNYGSTGFDLSQFSLVGHPLNLINSVNPVNSAPIMGVPQTLMRPVGVDAQQRNNLGFQMNPVSKNKKKWMIPFVAALKSKGCYGKRKTWNWKDIVDYGTETWRIVWGKVREEQLS